MSRIKETVELRYHRASETYKVVKLTNRLTPYVGEVLSRKEVEDLLIDAKRPINNMTIKIVGQ